MQLIENASEQKLRGAYYTPSAIAEFILRWGTCNGSTADILEPSCGDSVFLRGMAKIGMPYRSVTAVESQSSSPFFFHPPSSIYLPHTPTKAPAPWGETPSRYDDSFALCVRSSFTTACG